MAHRWRGTYVGFAVGADREVLLVWGRGGSCVAYSEGSCERREKEGWEFGVYEADGGSAGIAARIDLRGQGSGEDLTPDRQGEITDSD